MFVLNLIDNANSVYNNAFDVMLCHIDHFLIYENHHVPHWQDIIHELEPLMELFCDLLPLGFLAQ